MMHPDGEPARQELDEYMEYALEGRRRVKEQMNKRKPDDEFADINMTYFKETGEEVVVYCPESRKAEATQKPIRKKLDDGTSEFKSAKKVVTRTRVERVPELPIDEGPKEKHFKIFYGETGYTYEKLFSDYLKGVKSISVEDPYIRSQHQIQNFIRFCELVVKIGNVKQMNLVSGFDHESQKQEADEKFSLIGESLREHGIDFKYQFSNTLHDRQVKMDNGWIVKIGRGFDIYQKPDNWFSIGSNELELRPCLEAMVDIFRA